MNITSASNSVASPTAAREELTLSSAVVRVENSFGNRADQQSLAWSDAGHRGVIQAGTNQTQRDALQDAQRSELIQRATTEQARRAADCARTCVDTLMTHVSQPWLIVDREAIVLRWSERLEQATDTDAAALVGKSLTDLLGITPVSPSLQARFFAAFRAAKCSPLGAPTTILEEEFPFLPALTTSRITFIAQHRIPSTVEAVILLLVPA